MKNLLENVRLDTIKPEITELDVLTVETRRDINFFETLCAYCADNNIYAGDFDDYDFDKSVEFFKDYVASCRRLGVDTVYFWIVGFNK